MKPSMIAGAFLAAFGLVHGAANPPEIVLWPDGMPEPVVASNPPEKTETGTDGLTRRWYVSRPRLFVHRPPAGVKANGAAVVVAPGGGFGRLADEHEGSDIAAWLSKQGIVAFQLAYRTPTTNHAEPNSGPVQDCQRAVAEVRRRAAEYGIDSRKVGLMGFSAGGQAALVAATNGRRYPGADTDESVRPDFLMLVYPYKIIDPSRNALRPDVKLDGPLPPTFIAQMGDDTGSVPQGSVRLYLELLERKVPAELHIYERGGHGFGMRPRPGATGPSDWPARAADWLQLRFNSR